MNLTNDLRLKISRITIATAFIAMILISFRLWLNDRNYPLAPVFDSIPYLPSPVHYLQPGLMIALLVLIVFNVAPRFIVSGFVILFWLLVLGDQNRLQTFNYIFSFMLLPFAFYKRDDGEGKEFILNCLRIIIIGTYFWAGVQKLNIGFVDRMYPYFAGKIHISGFEPGDLIRKFIILAIPAFEILLAFGFMIKPTRGLAVVLATFMHLGVAIFMSPAGFGWNLVLIPWNAGLIFIVAALFWKSEVSFKELWSPQRYILKIAVIILFIVMPVFNFFGMWDHNLSASIFSSRPKYGAVVVDEELKQAMTPYLRKYLRTKDGQEFLECTYWMLDELNVTPYPEERVYKTNLEYICRFSKEKPCKAELIFH